MSSHPLQKILTAETLNSKGNTWETEIASVNNVIFEHIKGTDNILEDIVSHLRSVHVYDSQDPESE